MNRLEDELEHKLLLLGRQEVDIEIRMRQLRERARDSGRCGRKADADEAWNMFEALRGALRPLQDDISKVEKQLYGLRRSQRK